MIIPNIAFKSAEAATEIEFLELSELFARLDNNPNHNPRKPHRIDFFALLIVSNGVGIHQVDLKNYSLKRGSVVKIAKGQVHAFQENLSYDGYLVVFTEDFVLKNFSNSSIEFISHLYNYHISAPLVENSSYNEFFHNQIMKELESENQYAKKEIIAKMLELYLLRLEQQSQNSRACKFEKKHQALFLRFKNLLEENYAKTRNVKDYAAWLNTSPKHLNHITRAITFNTAKLFIDQYVILEIKRAILSTNNSLKEIAFQMGFDEVTNFTKFFKKHTEITPKEFKRTN